MTNPSNTYRIQHHLHAECSALSVVKQIKSRNKLEKCKKKVCGMKKIRKCLPKKPETRIYTWPTNMAVVDFLQSALFWSFVENVATDSGTRSCPLSFSQRVDLLPQSSVRNWVLGSTEPASWTTAACLPVWTRRHGTPGTPNQAKSPHRRHLATHSWHSRLISDVWSRTPGLQDLLRAPPPGSIIIYC